MLEGAAEARRRSHPGAAPVEGLCSRPKGNVRRMGMEDGAARSVPVVGHSQRGCASWCVMVLIIVRTSAMEYQLRLPVSASIKCFITTTEDGGQVKIKPLHINHNVMGLRVRQMSPYFRRYSRRPPPQHWSPSRDARLFTIRYSGSRASMASRGDGRHDARLWLSGTGTNDFVVVRALR